MANEQAVALDRLRRALLAFQAAESFFVTAHQRLEARPQADVEAYWDGPGLSHANRDEPHAKPDGFQLRQRRIHPDPLLRAVPDCVALSRRGFHRLSDPARKVRL